jgi:endogenous inhibitor of DNA gyrase (YacG/DUF329 family)
MADSKGRVVPIRKKRCPICGQTVVEKHRPFCSKACADRDLDRWLSGTYRIPSEETGEGDEDGPESPPESSRDR